MLTSRLAISFVLKGSEEGDGGEKKKKEGRGGMQMKKWEFSGLPNICS